MFTNALICAFVKDSHRTEDPKVRFAYGRLAGVSGIVANGVLFLVKLLVGLLSGSLAVVADGFNNLSDAGSSVVTLVGFRLAAAPADKEHPFGHGRMEYLSALTVAALIMVAGVELLTAALDKIANPTVSEFSWLSGVLLLIAVGVKLWMSLFFRRIGSAIRSEAITASAADSRNDVICTAVVLASSVFTSLTAIPVDGYVGAAVSLFVIWSGFSVIRETVSPLLGEAPAPELVENIKRIVLAADGVVGIHDLIVHNYGPGRCIVSLHAEVPAHGDILNSHEVIDAVEQQLMQELGVVACIHMDPVDTRDERVGTLRLLTETVLQDIDPVLSMHDFRVVFGEHHINVIFDVVIPFGYTGRERLQQEIQRRLQLTDPRLFVVLTVEHSYV